MPPKSLLKLNAVETSSSEPSSPISNNEALKAKNSNDHSEKKKSNNLIYAQVVKRKESMKRTSSTSIYKMKDDIMKESNKDKSEVDLSDKPREKFDNSELLKKWSSYADLLNNQGRQGMFTTLTKYQPKLLEDNLTIFFEIDSEVQRLELQEESVEILNFLRSELNNYGMKLIFKVLESDKSTKKHLNSKEIFLKMAENNSDLKQLRDKFNLDIEY